MMIKAYGSWPSPLSSGKVTSDVVGLSAPTLTSAGAWWVESRPREGGRNVLMHRTPDGQEREAVPAEFSVRSRVHEYGGGAFMVHEDRGWFCNDADQALYALDAGGEVRKLTRTEGVRYADMVFDSERERLIAVREDHRNAGEAINTLVAIDIRDGTETLLTQGEDFYSSPVLSPDGNRLAWLSWRHPDMPWDHTQLWLTDLDAAGKPVRTSLVAGDVDESVFQPRWLPDGTLIFVSDRSNWWNLYALHDNRTRELLRIEAEFGLPQWLFGMSTYAALDNGTLLCTYTRNGAWALGALSMESGQFTLIDCPYTQIDYMASFGRQVMFVGSSPKLGAEIAHFDADTETITVLKSSIELEIDPAYLAYPEAIEFPTADGLTAHALYYPPCNPDCTAPVGELPPLLVRSHGGPTAAASSTLDLNVQYWTSRGFGLLDVNYGGSTGYGREYRQRLNGQWGVVDVADCVNGARYLVEHGRVDQARLAIRGSSAGGYTALAALAFSDAFSAGASLYGIGELSSLAMDTHKFESRYLDRLVGPWLEARGLYSQRSPINAADRISAPVIFFQGLQDRVVPPSQAENMVATLEAKGMPVAYVPFESEQHGFRQAKNIRQALDGEWWFYGQVWGFEVPEPPQPITIRNLRSSRYASKFKAKNT